MSTEFYPIEEIEADLELQNKAAKEIIDKILMERIKKEGQKCARSACKRQLIKNCYRIWNDPTNGLGYRYYCVSCGRKIMECNKEMFSGDDLLKFEIIEGE